MKNIFKDRMLTLTILFTALAMLIGAVATVDLVQKVFPGERDDGTSMSLGEAPVGTVMSDAPIAAKLDTSLVYFIAYARDRRWCIADPAHNGVAGGPGTHLVLWQCQANWWFGWTGVAVNTGPYRGLGYRQIRSQANGLCMQTTKTLPIYSGAVFVARCNVNEPNQMFGEYDKAVNTVYLETLNTAGRNLELADNGNLLRNGNPIVGWVPFLCAKQPITELWSPVLNGNNFNVCSS